MSHGKLTRALASKKHSNSLAELIFDFGVAQPLTEFISAERTQALLDEVLDEQLTDRWVRRHLRPSLEREHARASRRDDRLADWLSPDLLEALRVRSERPVHLEPNLVRRAVQEGAARDILKGIVEDTLERFVRSRGSAESRIGGLLGTVGRGALGAASKAGRGFLGQLGGQLETHFRDAIAAFVETSSNALMDRVVLILTSEEMARQLGESRRRALEGLLKVSSEDLWRFLSKELADDALLKTVPAQIRHLLASDDFRQLLHEEISAAVATETSIESMLTLEQIESARGHFVAVLSPLIRRFSKSPEFRDWLPT